MNDLKKRTFDYAVRVARLIVNLPPAAINKAYCNQLIRCSSSIGANYRAAQRAKSTADFIHKLKIVEEEADGTVYFLELLLEFNKAEAEIIIGLINEGTEILRIIVASLKTARANLDTSP